MAEQRKYSAAEVQEILRRAADKSAATQDELDHDDLVAAAREAGIDPAAVEAAAGEVQADRAHEDVGRELRAKKRQGFLSHLSAYVIVNVALVLMSLFVTGRPWSAMVAIGWGIGLAFHLLSAFREPTREEINEFVIARGARDKALERVRDKLRERQDEHDRRARETAEKSQKKQEKQRRKEQLAQASEALESAVEQGVAAALKAAAQQIDQLSKKASDAPASTDFARYVQEKKGKGEAAPQSAASQPSRAATGVRVDASAVESTTDEAEAARSEPVVRNTKART
jgi:hypothetical protein